LDLSPTVKPHCRRRDRPRSDSDRAAHLTEKLLEVIAPEVNREPRTPDNVWCVIEAVACVVAGLIKEPVARRYFGRALDHYSHDLASRGRSP
jgi:hypothetical protein